MAITTHNNTDAVIFIPDMGNHIGVDLFAERFAAELDRNTLSAHVSYDVVRSGDDKHYQSGISKTDMESVRSIIRNNGENKNKVADIYYFEYAKTLRNVWSRKNNFKKSMMLFFTLINLYYKLFCSFFTVRSKRLSEQFQIAYAMLLMLFLSIYMIIVIIAVAGVVKSVIPSLGIEISKWTSNIKIEDPLNILVVYSGHFVIISALIKSFVPDYQKTFTSMVESLMGVIDYISLGEYKDIIAGRFADMLDYISSNNYERIHVVSYSMGSVIALDNIFPYGDSPSLRVNNIYSLTTIGCPYDFIRLFWGYYFEGRGMLKDVPIQWLNVYSPSDILGSNFRDDAENEEADHSVSIKKMGDSYYNDEKIGPIPENIVFTGGINIKGILQWFSFFGIRNHGVYFEDNECIEKGCLSGIIHKLYAGKPILA